MVLEEPAEASQEVPKVPQDPPEDEVITKQTKDVEGEKSFASRRSSAQQGKPVQPKPSHTSIQSGLQTGPGSPLLTKDHLAPLSPEESKTIENNIAHMRHLRETMKKGLEKWDEEIGKEENQIKQACMESEIERLKR